MMNNKDLKAIAIGCAYKIHQHARKNITIFLMEL